MRLSYAEQKAILKSFYEVFKEGKIYLFGSRVESKAKGGDIDLYIVPKDRDNLAKKKIDFLVSLKDKIGEQKIDVLIAQDNTRAIEQEAINKGVELSLKQMKIEKYLNECNKHKIRIEKSYAKVKEIFPLSAPRYQNLSDDEIEAIDQYLFRFSKLQDTLGQRVFRLIVSEYEDSVEALTFIDILNRLEKIGILEDVNIWKRLRDIRNDIAHQYDDEPQQMAEALNNIFAYKAELISILEAVELFLNKRDIHE